mmetsp:Transcript_2363/g.4895  ORF Transcript_2363/g.4895 Transcript_2363/m.4895 type:complete len:137 (-) Transcript_2363:529-939(-)
MLAEAIAYVLLRPFLGDVPSHQFPGARDRGLGDSIEVTARWHACLLRAKVSIGHVNPGDTVWWHPDIIHAVEQEHLGTNESNVFYIGATPLCPLNARYLARQRTCFKNGDAPPDFPSGQQLALERGSQLLTRPRDL